MIQDFYILLKLLREFHLPNDKRELLVTKRLQRVLCSAYNNTKYYKKLMDDSGYNPNIHYKDPEDLKKLRITTKKDLKENPIKDFINESARTKNIFTDSTSGSTGIPLKVYRNSIERKYQIAKWLRVLFLNGYKPHQKVLSITSPSRLDAGKSFLQKFGLLRRKPINYLLSPERMTEEILDYKPDVIYGNTSHIDLIANDFLVRKIKLQNLKMIIAGGETINEKKIQNYLSAFNSKFIQVYGSVELGSIAFDISDQGGMVLNDDLTYFEFIDDNKKVINEMEFGQVIATDLIGKFMPFIRYSQGDKIEFRIHNNRKRIIKILGREDDIILTPDGKKITFHPLYEIFHHYQLFREFKVIQTKINEIVVEIDCDKDIFEKLKEDVLNNLKSKISSTISYIIKNVSPIKPDESGKIRMFKSELKTDE